MGDNNSYFKIANKENFEGFQHKEMTYVLGERDTNDVIIVSIY